MRSKLDFNDGWLFEGRDQVRLPHTAVELPFSYFDERAYQRVFTYEKHFEAKPEWVGKDVVVVFDGAMANAKVSLNGKPLGGHADGYTPFEFSLTDGLRGGENTLVVTIDGSENPEIPPFGGVIDYLTYAGIYREAWLDIRPNLAISNVKVETPDVLADHKRVTAAVTLSARAGAALSGTLDATIVDVDGVQVAHQQVPVSGTHLNLAFDGLSGIRLWDIVDPTLYTLRLKLTSNAGEDSRETRFGFRSVSFTTDGFALNGQIIKLRGLNRHQAFPYVGYALGKSAQVRDADILKNELKLNMVRTSHYPQSTWFLDRCDEIGLLVFEEIPGWQHIGGDNWKDESVRNVERMITRDWNHPSIVIWGVRINESQDSHEFYTRTNRLARELDSTRPTGGVRFITNSELLEDVYTMNDFILGNEELGGNRPRTPLRPQREVTGLPDQVPYMITEYGGHMYPTKIYDQEQRQAEHVTRHLEVMNAMYGDPQIAGAIGWCAFDYNTHKDFGSGDRICYHGVMDMFREPKFAANVYKSQCSPIDEPVLEPVTFWARGERNIGGVLPLIILTNCDEIEMRYGDSPPKRFARRDDLLPNLPYPPIVLRMEDFTADELGKWGMRWEHGYFAGYVDGKKVIEKNFVADPVASELRVEADAGRVTVNQTVRVMARVVDQVGNKLPFLFDPLTISVEGAGRLIGPSTVPAQGGSVGFWIEAQKAGAIHVSVAHPRLGTQKLELNAHTEIE